jgi:hypothetical protein
VKTTFLLAAMLIGAGLPVLAQPVDKIPLALDVRSEGRATADAVGARIGADVRRGLEALPDVEIVPSDGARRNIWIIAGTPPGSYAASVIVTERYDRETLMVLGIEDDYMAHRMMALQIVTDHQIYTSRTIAALVKRIVTSLDEGVLAKVRSFARRPAF